MDYTIKDLPQEERPREKLEERGASSLSDVELLSLVLRTGIPGKNVKELSAEILSSYSLPGLSERSLEELKCFGGVSRVKAGQLVAVGELARRMQVEDREKIESLEDVKARVEDMKFMEKEVMRAFYLSSGNELLAEDEFEGSVSSVSVDPEEVFRQAVRRNASVLILAHNHPSGKDRPTQEDIEFTEEMIGAGESIGVRLLDHVIVGERVSSMRASTALEFDS